MQSSYFISYSHDDREAVENIRRGIHDGSQRFQIWLDECFLQPGDDIASKIQELISRCSIVLFVVSRNSLRSDYCRREINLAYNNRRKIVPLRLQSESELPEGDLPLQIQGVKSIDFSANFDDGLKRLCTFLACEVQGGSPSSINRTGPVEIHNAHDLMEDCRDLANLAAKKQASGDLLGSTLYCMASLDLARKAKDGVWEARVWNIIGDLLGSLGQISAAMQANERALKLARDNYQREIEVVARVNLGQHYEAMGDDNRAQEECDRVCRIVSTTRFQLGESAARRNLGILKLSQRKFKLAAEEFNKALKLADITQSVQLQQTIRIELALSLLLDGELSEAETTISEALRYDTPLFSPEAYALNGVILQQQGKVPEAAQSFSQALEQAQAVLKRTSGYYRALDTMGLGYSGLTLAEGEPYLDEAIGVYQASHFLTHEPGIVRRRLLLFDALAQSDSEKTLPLVRKAIDPGL